MTAPPMNLFCSNHKELTQALSKCQIKTSLRKIILTYIIRLYLLKRRITEFIAFQKNLEASAAGKISKFLREARY